MATKVVKWKKVPGYVVWKDVQAKLTRDAKKRKFTRRLKEGNRRGTSGPGPH